MSAYDEFVEYLKFVGTDISTDMTLKKFNVRACNQRGVNGKLYFEMDRHNQILGASYTPGVEMNAFVTIREFYEFDPAKNSIRVIDQKPRVIEIDEIKFYSLAQELLGKQLSISVAVEDDGSVFRLSSDFLEVSAIVGSKEKAQKIIAQYAARIDLSAELATVAEFSQNIRDEIASRLNDACTSYALRVLDEAWKKAAAA